MRHHRLDRLARLTHGAALVGIGLFDVACTKEPVKPEEPHINATAMPMPSDSAPLPNINATATPPPVDVADAADAPRPHTINATAAPPQPSFRPPARLNAPTKSSSSP